MGENLISEEGDVLEHAFSEESLTFSLMGNPEMIKAIRDSPFIQKLEHSYFPEQGIPSDRKFRQITERWDQIKNEDNVYVKNLYHQSIFISTLCVVVPDEYLEEFCDLISCCAAIPYFAPGLKLMIIQPKFTRMFDNLDLFFSVLDNTHLLSPTFTEAVKFDGTWGRQQVFNYPTADLDDFRDESVASFYGVECDWKTQDFPKKENYVSYFPQWWQFNSDLLKKNRVPQTKEEDKDQLSDLAESISLNRTSIIEMSWELENIKNKIGEDESL